MGKVLLNTARAYGMDSQWEMAVDQIQKALTYLSEEYNGASYHSNPNPGLSNTKLDLLKALIVKAQLLKDYAKEKTSGWLGHAGSFTCYL